MRRRVACELRGGRDHPPNRGHARREVGVGLDLRAALSSSLSTRRERQVEALAPRGHRRMAHDVVGPCEPRTDEQRCRDGCDGRGGGPFARSGRPHGGGEHDQGNGEDENRPDERERSHERAGGGPPPDGALLPRAGERVRRGDRDRPRQRLAQHERDVVLRPGVDRVESAGEQSGRVAPPAPNGRDQEERTEREEHALADQRGCVVGPHDLLLAEEREVQRVPGGTKCLTLGLFPDAPRYARARDVEPAVRVDVVEAGFQRRRVARVANRVSRRDVRPAVRLLVRVDQREVEEAVQSREHGQRERAAPKGRSPEPHGKGL
jgi:hypothetical protein